MAATNGVPASASADYRRADVDWRRYNLANDDDGDGDPHPQHYARTRPRGNAGGFVDLGAEYQYAAGGHQASGANEIFAEDQGDRPWWRTQFFISQPVLFGTWDGVFTACMINIFGVIVFLRSGWIVAQAGVLNAVALVLVTVGIALVSVLSAVGICERCRIESGGVYFLIAHTLGSRFGGALGLLYCFGQAVGCALNVLGFGESMAGLVGLGESKWAVRGFAAAAVLALGVINIAGVKWVVKLQFMLLIVLLLSALDFMVGSFVNEDEGGGFVGWSAGVWAENLWPAYTDGYTWFRVFGVFFPTVTGVLSGINMSGDLRAPSTDIPNGTLAAFGTSTFLYMVFVLILGATCRRATLLTDFMIAVRVSAVEVLLLAGVYVSSMSSCLGAMYGTPRVLQSIALENVIPAIGVLGRGRGPNKVPLYAMGVVATVTITFIIIGDINTLAPIVTMPFLLTYACIDYAYFALAQTFDIQTRREERFRIQASSPSYETRAASASRRYGSTQTPADEEPANDLDHLFPDRTRHKNLAAGGAVANGRPAIELVQTPQPPSKEEEADARDASGAAVVVVRCGTRSPSSGETEKNVDDEELEPIAPIRPPIHSKTKNWYSGYCNRWASLLGAILKIVVMLLVNWLYAVVCIGIVLVVWIYIGAANPAVKPGLAAEFQLFVWLKSVVFRCFGKRSHEYERIVVTPSCPSVAMSSARLNDDNEDFASRRRYHQSSVVQGRYVEDI